MTAARALDGVRVLEWTDSAAGQVAGMLLADLGADVVRVLPDGDGERVGLPGWLCWNRGKTLVAGSDRIDHLLVRADVLVDDGTHAALSTRGHTAATLRDRAPGLVSVWMPATRSPYLGHELPNDQLLLDAISGFAANHPALEERPIASVTQARPMIQGALGAVAAMAGLLARTRDGWGRAATVTGLHAEAATLATLVNESVDGPAKVAPGRSVSGGPYFRLYQGGDGRWFYLAALSPELFIGALDVMDRLDVFALPSVAGEFLNFIKPEVTAEVNAELETTIAEQSAEEWVRRFEGAGVPAALLSDPDDWLGSDVVAHACPPVRRRHPDVGEVTMPGPPLDLSGDGVGAGELPSSSRPAVAADVWPGVDPLPAPAGLPPGADDRPLAGLRVIDTATFLAAPFVSTLLAAHGADVVKIEAPTGDPYGIYTHSYGIINEHKPRLAVDLSDEEGRRLFLELVALADVVVDNLTAAKLARMDLGPERYDAANPALVRCSVTAFGAVGPYADLPGFDPVLQTLSGLAAVQGGAGRPITINAPVHDVAVGCLGALGTLAALWRRHQTGQGQRVFTSLAASSTFLQSGDITDYAGRPARPVGGPDFPGPSSWHRFYRAADGWIGVSAATDTQRRSLLALLDRSGLWAVDDDERAVAIEAVTGREPGEALVVRLLDAGVPAGGAVERGRELIDPFLLEQDFSHVVETVGVGRIRAASGYTDWDHAPRRPPLPASQLGVDLVAVRARWTAGGG